MSAIGGVAFRSTRQGRLADRRRRSRFTGASPVPVGSEWPNPTSEAPRVRRTPRRAPAAVKIDFWGSNENSKQT